MLAAYLGSLFCVALLMPSALHPEAQRTQLPQIVGLQPRKLGGSCYSSFYKIGDNVPTRTSDRAHVVVDIHKIALVMGRISTLYGFIYIDADGSKYEGRASYDSARFDAHGQTSALAGPLSSGDIWSLRRKIRGKHPGAMISITGCFRAATAHAEWRSRYTNV